MKCGNCGRKVPDNFEKCPYCGCKDSFADNKKPEKVDEFDVNTNFHTEGKNILNNDILKNKDSCNVSYYNFVKNKIASKYRITLYLFINLLFFDLLYVVSRSESIFITITGIVLSMLLSYGMLFAGNLIFSATIILYQTFLFSIVRASVSIFAIIISYIISLAVIFITLGIKREYKKYKCGSYCGLVTESAGNIERKKYEPHVRRTVFISGIVIVASLTSIFVSFSVYKVTKYSEIDRGRWTAGVYRNDFAELSFTLPEGWTYFDDNALNEYYEFVNDDETDSSIEDGGMLMYAHDGENSSIIAVELIDMKRWYSANKVISTWAYYYTDNVEKGYSYSYDGIESIELGSNEYKYVNGKYKYTNSDKINSNELVLVRTHGKYCISITIITKGSIDPSLYFGYFN